MTSANFFNGYAAEKPSSRVMAPPGGRSNSIFGGYDEPAAPPRAAPVVAAPNKPAAPQMSAQQEAAANKMHQNGGINLFESVANNGHTGHQQQQGFDANSITQSHRGAGIKPKDNSQSNIFGDYSASNGASKPVDRQKSTVFEEEKPAVQQHTNGGNSHMANNNKARSGYNTITGKTYEDEQSERVASAKVHVQHQSDTAAETKSNNLHTSSRVLQPPGGRSTGLW